MQKINKKILEKLQQAALPVEKCLYFLLGTYYGIPTKEISLQKNYVLQMIKLGIIETTNALYSVPNLFFNSNDVITEAAYSIEQDIEENIKEFRLLFGKANTRVGMMGDKSMVAKKLLRFIQEHPQYSMRIIIDKTKAYINKKKQLNEEIYIPQADYFIYKNVSGQEKSTLATIIDENFEDSIIGFDKII